MPIDRDYARRLGGLTDFAPAQHLRMSEARQICRTWRSHVAFRLAAALGMVRPPRLGKVP